MGYIQYLLLQLFDYVINSSQFSNYTHFKIWHVFTSSIPVADAAQQLIRNVQYEIPAMKKQIAKCQQQCQVCIKAWNLCPILDHL